MSEFKQYCRKQIAELRPYIEGEKLSDRVSISPADKDAGSPKAGDMIARNPKNHDDQWLVAADYFAENFASLGDLPSDWRSIETVPKDGTKVLCGQFDPEKDCFGYYSVDRWHVSKVDGYEGLGNFNHTFWPATHWMPLPEPPEQNK